MFRYLSVSTLAGRSANGCRMTATAGGVSRGGKGLLCTAGSGLYFLERRQRQRQRKRLHAGGEEKDESRESEREGDREIQFPALRDRPVPP